MELQEIIDKRPNEIITDINITDGFIMSDGSEEHNFFVKSSWSNDDVYDIKYSLFTIERDQYMELYDSTEGMIFSSYKNVLFDMKYKRPFEYCMLKRINIICNEDCLSGTAMTYFDEILKDFVIEYNPRFVYVLSMVCGCSFEKSLQFVLEHELLHIVRKHVNKEEIEEGSFEIENLVQDLVINNYLSNVLNIVPRLGINNSIPFTGELRHNMSLRDIVIKAERFGIIKPTRWKECSRQNYSGRVSLRYYNKKDNLDELELSKSIIMFLKDIFKEVEPNKQEGQDEVCISVDQKTIERLSEIMDSSLNESKEIEESPECKRESNDRYQYFRGNGYGKTYSLAKSSINDIARPIGYRKSEIPWKVELRRYMRTGLSSEEVYHQNSPNARIEGQFGRDIDVQIPKRILFAIDVSGSMGIEDYEFCLSEIESIVKAMRLKRIIIDVVWWGSSVVEESFRSYRDFKKRCERNTPSLGGTDIRLCLDTISKYKKEDIRFILTDGEFSDNTKHKEDIIWCITKDGTTRSIKSSSKDKIVQPK